MLTTELLNFETFLACEVGYLCAHLKRTLTPKCTLADLQLYSCTSEISLETALLCSPENEGSLVTNLKVLEARHYQMWQIRNHYEMFLQKEHNVRLLQLK